MHPRRNSPLMVRSTDARSFFVHRDHHNPRAAALVFDPGSAATPFPREQLIVQERNKSCRAPLERSRGKVSPSSSAPHRTMGRRTNQKETHMIALGIILLI